MDNVLHVPAFQDNYIWLIQTGAKVAIVDPGDAQPVIATLERDGLRPVAILCTHHHHDHVGGAQELSQRYGVPVYGPAQESIPSVQRRLDDGDHFEIPELGIGFDVLAIPGHTLGHIAFYSDAGGHGLLFCGDTLFSAGCGRLFEGTAEQMHTSLTRLAALPQDTQVFCGHEYTAANLRFALTVEPDNQDARELTARVRDQTARGQPSLPSSIGLERRINPFLRTAVPSVRQAVAAHEGGALTTEVEIFAALRRWKDGFRG